ncbi:hypothetical protein [Streptomyces sp. NPDC013457]|uniref:hypothetical protein n=1 Tax=Streptomyces sp. NPDC013457 TaxID=3364866 RepID=UPI0037010014
MGHAARPAAPAAYGDPAAHSSLRRVGDHGWIGASDTWGAVADPHASRAVSAAGLDHALAGRLPWASPA